MRKKIINIKITVAKILIITAIALSVIIFRVKCNLIFFLNALTLTLLVYTLSRYKPIPKILSLPTERLR